MKKNFRNWGSIGKCYMVRANTASRRSCSQSDHSTKWGFGNEKKLKRGVRLSHLRVSLVMLMISHITFRTVINHWGDWMGFNEMFLHPGFYILISVVGKPDWNRAGMDGWSQWVWILAQGLQDQWIVISCSNNLSGLPSQIFITKWKASQWGPKRTAFEFF